MPSEEESPRPRRTFTREFKGSDAKLVTEQGSSLKEAAGSLGVGRPSIALRARRFAPPPSSAGGKRDRRSLSDGANARVKSSSTPATALRRTVTESTTPSGVPSRKARTGRLPDRSRLASVMTESPGSDIGRQNRGRKTFEP